MSWRDEPVKVGDRFETEKGGVVEVVATGTGFFSARNGNITAAWYLNFDLPTQYHTARERFGNIINKIKEAPVSDFKVGPCTLTSKDGKSKLVGKIVQAVVESKLFDFKIGESYDLYTLRKADWTPDYPLPPLPTAVGSVISVDGDHFLLTRAEYAWASTRRIGTGGMAGWSHLPKDMEQYCASHGGFTVVLEGKAE